MLKSSITSDLSLPLHILAWQYINSSWTLFSEKSCQSTVFEQLLGHGHYLCLDVPWPLLWPLDFFLLDNPLALISVLLCYVVPYIDCHPMSQSDMLQKDNNNNNNSTASNQVLIIMIINLQPHAELLLCEAMFLFKSLSACLRLYVRVFFSL